MTPARSEHYSGLLVTTLPGQLEACIEALDGQAGITVSLRDQGRNRMIVVLEAPSRDALEELHQRVRSVSGVVTADPVVHYVDDRPQDPVPGS